MGASGGCFEDLVSPEWGSRCVIQSSRRPLDPARPKSFLLPIFARLFEEARTWPRPADINQWWSSARRARRAMDAIREAFKNVRTRYAAVRALMSYPTNALVEDQIARLRHAVLPRALETDKAVVSSFGRYTGVTPVDRMCPALFSDRRVRRYCGGSRSRLKREFDGLPTILKFECNFLIREAGR